MNKSIYGSNFILLATVIYAFFGVISRHIVSFGPFSQSWIKGFFNILIAAAIILFGKITWKKIRKKDIKWFLIWILPASFQPVMTFLAFNNLPLGMVYFLSYSTMLLGGVISGKMFFSEKFTIQKFISSIFLFLGLFLIYRSDISLAGNIYVLLSLLAGFALGFWNTLSKKVSEYYSEYQMIILDSVTSLIFCLIVSVLVSEKLVPFSDYGPWLWIFTFSLLAVVATYFLIKGFKTVEAQVGSLIMPMEIVFGSLFGFIFFGEILKANAYLGGFSILIGALIASYKKKD
jgi:drug/metabolite transporter (DMT)-like permease